MCIGSDAAPAWQSIANRNHGAPFGKTGAHLKVFSEAVAQSVETFGHSFTGMRCQLLGSCVHFDSRSDSRLDENLDKGDAAFCLLTDRLVVEDRSADTLTKPW